MTVLLTGERLSQLAEGDPATPDEAAALAKEVMRLRDDRSAKTLGAILGGIASGFGAAARHVVDDAMEKNADDLRKLARDVVRLVRSDDPDPHLRELRALAEKLVPEADVLDFPTTYPRGAGAFPEQPTDPVERGAEPDEQREK